MIEIGGVYRSQSKQWMAASAATLAMVNVGNEEFWLVKTLTKVQHFFWVGFFAAATSSVIGAILGGVLSERFGRRRTLLATSIFAIIRIVGSFSTNGVFSCVTMFFGEIGVGMTRVVVPLYVSEIVDDDIRGALLMLQVPFFYIGKLIAVGIGNLVSAEVLGVVSLISTGIFLVTFMRFPETPYYLSSQKKDDAANKSLAFFRGIECVTVEDDIEVIMKNVEVTDDTQRFDERFRELLRPTNRKALFIIMFLIIINWSEQIFDFRNYMISFISGSVVSNNYHAQIIAHATSLFVSISLVFIIDIIGRRSLLLYSTLVGSIILIISVILGGNQNHEWLYNAIAMILHLCVINMSSIPLVYVGELFSANVKALGITIVTTLNLLLSFVIITLHESMDMIVNAIIGLIFLLFAFPIAFAISPETKRKSYSEIQKELAVTSRSRCSRNKSTRTDQSR